jgi:hypothetical protein
MPGFVPNEHYVREMKRYGVLPASLDPNARPIDVYATDEAYWRLFWPPERAVPTAITKGGGRDVHDAADLEVPESAVPRMGHPRR